MPTNQDNRPGPDPEHLKLNEDDWKEAAKKALKRERPEGGWPKPDDEPKKDGEKG